MAKRVLQDKYFRKAKTEGYVARSAFKLKELQQKFELIQRGGRVLDLGCSPGSWPRTMTRSWPDSPRRATSTPHRETSDTCARAGTCSSW